MAGKGTTRATHESNREKVQSGEIKKDIQADFEIEDSPVEVARLREDVQPGQQFADVEQVMQVPVAFDNPELVTADTKEIDISTKFVPGYIAANIKQIQRFAALKKQEVEEIDVEKADADELAKTRASVRKVMKKIESTRIDLKKIYLEPFEQKIAGPLKAEYESLQESLSPLDEKITKAEEHRIKAKKSDIDDVLNERLGKESEEIDRFLHDCPWLTYVGNSSWLNKGATLKKITEEIDQKVSQAANEIKALGLFSSDNIHAPKMLAEYKLNGNLATALNLKERLEAERQEYLRIEEERKAREEARRREQEKLEEEARLRREAARKAPVESFAPRVEPVAESKPEPVVEHEPAPEEPVVELPEVEDKAAEELTITFTVTTKQATALLGFLRDNSIPYKVQ